MDTMRDHLEVDVPDAGSAPFLGPVSLSSHCPSRLQTAMSSLAVQHDLRRLEGRMSGFVTGFQVGEVRLAFVKYGTPTRVVADATGAVVCWTIPIDGMSMAIGANYARTMSTGFVLGRERPTTMLPNPRGGAVVITTTEARLKRHYSRLTGRPAPPLEVAPGPSLIAGGYLDVTWKHVVGVLQSLPHLPLALAHSLEETLLTALLLELPSIASVDLALTGDDAPATPAREHARRAVEWAQENLPRRFTLVEWASAVGVSVRHLQKTMQVYQGTSPTQYLMLQRLELAHEQLRHPGPGASVTNAASAAGFTHMSRFAAAYRARYGVTPSETLRRGGGASSRGAA